jgi:hypothetical protein
MRYDLMVSFSAGEDIALRSSDPMTIEQARDWLDAEFTRLNCEIARPSGKVLFVDKVLAVAQAAGPGAFADAAWAEGYTRATTGALRKAFIRVDVPNATVGF